MALGGEVDDGIDAVVTDNLLDRLAVRDVAAHKGMARVICRMTQVIQVPGIGQFVEDHQFVTRVFSQHVAHEVGADEARAAGNEKVFHGNQKLL